MLLVVVVGDGVAVAVAVVILVVAAAAVAAAAAVVGGLVGIGCRQRLVVRKCGSGRVLQSRLKRFHSTKFRSEIHSPN